MVILVSVAVWAFYWTRTIQVRKEMARWAEVDQLGIVEGTQVGSSIAPVSSSLLPFAAAGGGGGNGGDIAAHGCDCGDGVGGAFSAKLTRGRGNPVTTINR